MRIKLRLGSRERFIRFIFCYRIIKSKPHVWSDDAIGIILYDNNNNNLMVNVLPHGYKPYRTKRFFGSVTITFKKINTVWRFNKIKKKSLNVKCFVYTMLI